MQRLLRYSGITTKLRAMQGRLLKPDDFVQLASLDSIPAAVAFLREHPGYRDVFGSLDEKDLHRENIERCIPRTLKQDFNKIYRFVSIEQKEFLKIYFRRYEISFLKACFRKLFNNEEIKSNLTELEDFFRKYSRINVRECAACTHFDELIEAVKGTPYYAPLLKIRSYTGADLFDYEMTLDLFYFSSIWHNKYLKGKDLLSVRSLYGTQIDLLNIQWIYRARKYYDLPPAKTFALIIPVNYKLGKPDIAALVEAPDIAGMKNIFKTTYYSRYQPEDFLEKGETTYYQILNQLHKKAEFKNPYSPVCLKSYLYQKERETDNLTTVLECIRYGLDQEETLSYLIL